MYIDKIKNYRIKNIQSVECMTNLKGKICRFW